MQSNDERLDVRVRSTTTKAPTLSAPGNCHLSWVTRSCNARAMHSFKQKCNNMLFYFMFLPTPLFAIALSCRPLTASGFKAFRPYYAITSGLTHRASLRFVVAFTLLYIIEANIRIIEITYDSVRTKIMVNWYG